MSLKNSAVIYDKQLGAIAAYVLPEGKDISLVTKGKSIIMPGNFQSVRGIDTVSDRKIVSITKGKNKIPIRYVKDEVLLKFHLGISKQEIEEILREYNLLNIGADALAKIGYIKVKIPDGRDVIGVTKELRKEYKLKVPEPNYITNVLTVSDPLFNAQWYISDINFDKVWEDLNRKIPIKIAVIDSGVDVNHPDLKGKILNGFDFVNRDADALDDQGHGTFVAGIIAASANEIGIRGLYDYAQIIPVKVIDENGLGTYEDVAKGILYAADNGAKVINLSIGGYAYSFMLQEAVDYALGKGCVVVAAGGNDGMDQAIYPAAYPDVIGVSALGFEGKIWGYSNSGKHIAVSAPGVNIFSTGLNGDYVYASGTSSSAAMVSSLAAMLVSEKPDLSGSFIERLIIQSARDIGEEGRDKVYGNGKIDALSSLKNELKPFHDLAVRKVYLEPRTFNKGQSPYIVSIIENTGTFNFEKCDVVIYETIGEKKKEVAIKEEIIVRDRTKVVIAWKPEKFKDDIKFEVVVISQYDSDASNNSAISNAYLLEEHENLFILHKVNPPVHQWIAYQAKFSYSTPEINSYLPLFFSNSVSSLDNSWILYGARMEDDDNSSNACYPLASCSPCAGWSWDSGFTGYHPYCNHFWDPDGGKEEGLYYFSRQWHSAYRRAQYLWDNKIIPLYKDGQRDLSYYWLGRVAHLLADVAVPAHVNSLSSSYGNLDVHPFVESYESYMAEYNDDVASDYNFKQWSTSSSPTSASNLYALFYDMAEKADNYESNDADGEYASHYEGHNDALETQNGVFGWYDVSYAECRNHGNTLMSEAMRHVAGLYKLFWNETDDSYEENDSRSTAYNISSREQTWLENINGYGNQKDDDWYKIYVDSGFERVQIDLRFTDSDGDQQFFSI